MSRAPIMPQAFIDSSGDALGGRQVTVTDLLGGAVAVYAGATGGSALAAAMVATDPRGNFQQAGGAPFYVDGPGSYVGQCAGANGAVGLTAPGMTSPLAVGGTWASGGTVAPGQVLNGADGYYYVVAAGTTTLGATSAAADVTAGKLVGPIGATAASTELAYAENITGTNFSTTSTGAVDVPGLSISVPASARPVYLGASILFASTAAQFAIAINIVEVSNGVDTPVSQGRLVTYPTANNFTASDFTTRLASSTARTRNFKLQVNQGGAGTLTVYSIASRVWDMSLRAWSA